MWLLGGRHGPENTGTLESRNTSPEEKRAEFFPPEQGKETLWALLVASVVMGLAPGPDILFVLTQSALYGARAGFATTCGLITGLFVHITAVSLGVAALFQSSETAFNVLKFAGAAYLLYLAWLSFRSGTSKASLQKAQFPGYGTLYRRGVIMNITNPKVTLFFLAFLPQFDDPARGGLTAQIIVLGALFQLATLLVFGCVSLLAGRVAGRFNSSVKGQLFLNRAAGCVFTGLAVMLLVSSR